MRITRPVPQPPLDPKADSVLIALRLPPALLRALDAEAKRRGVTRSAAVRALIAEADKRAGRKGR